MHTTDLRSVLEQSVQKGEQVKSKWKDFSEKNKKNFLVIVVFPNNQSSC